MGAVLIGGLIEGCLGLLARYWKKIITTPPHLLSAVISVFPGKDSISVCCSKG